MSEPIDLDAIEARASRDMDRDGKPAAGASPELTLALVARVRELEAALVTMRSVISDAPSAPPAPPAFDPRQRIIDWREQAPDELPDDAIDAIADVLKPVLIALCDRLGCRLVPDHCNRREHDYCLFCGRGRAKEGQ